MTNEDIPTKCLYVLKNGVPTPAPWNEWAVFLGMTPERLVAENMLNGELSISTCFSGIDWSHGAETPPKLWQTALVRGFNPIEKKDVLERYASHAEAWDGHFRIVERVKKELGL